MVFHDSYYSCSGRLVCYFPNLIDSLTKPILVCNPLTNTWRALPLVPPRGTISVDVKDRILMSSEVARYEASMFSRSDQKGILDLESLSEEMLNLPCGEKSIFLASNNFLIAVWKDGRGARITMGQWHHQPPLPYGGIRTRYSNHLGLFMGDLQWIVGRESYGWRGWFVNFLMDFQLKFVT
jgi:hypothetical protein